MELIYMHIENIERIKAHKLDLNFNPRFTCSLEKGRIIINNTNDWNSDFYGSKICNLSLILGANGLGKSTLLDRIGLDAASRSSEISKNDSYFLLYITNEEKFVLECYNCDNVIKELPPDDYNGDKHKRESSFIAHKGGKYIIPTGLYSVSNENTENITYYFRDKDYNFSELLDYKKDTDSDIGTYWFQRKFMNKSWEGLLNICHSSAIKDLENFRNKSFDFVFYPIIYTDYFYTDIIHKKSLILNLDELLDFSSKDIEKYIIKYLYGLFEKLFEEKYMISYYDKGTLYHDVNSKFTSNKRSIFEKIRKEYDSIDSYSRVKEYLLKLLKEVSFMDMGFDDVLLFFDKMEKIKYKSINMEKMELTINDNSKENLDFLNKYDSFNGNLYSFGETIYKSLKCYIEKMSSGELQLISVLSRVYTAIENPYYSNTETITLLFDEVEEKMHPEWNRKLIKNIVDLVNSQGKENIKYNIIFTSHSPFLASDVLKENIICLKLSRQEKLEVVKSNFGFMSNISELYANNFFLEYNVGEFALSKLDNFIDNIKQLPLDYVIFFIDSIGDEVVRNNLKAMYINENKEFKIIMNKQEIDRLMKENELLIREINR